MKSCVAVVWELAWKDLRLFLADRRGVLLCFAVPIALASLFGCIFQRTPDDAPIRLPLIVVVEDHHPATERIVTALRASAKLETTCTKRDAALKKLSADGAGVVLILSQGFGEALQQYVPGGPSQPAIRLLHHPASSIQSAWAEGLLTETIMRDLAGRWLPGQDGRQWQPPLRVQRLAVVGPEVSAVNSFGHSFCGMCLQYLLFWGMDSGILLLRERRQGIWRRLRIAPVPLWTLLAGKTLATAMVALAQIAVTFTFGRLVFGVKVEGSLAGFAAMAVAAALLSAATGLLVAALGGREGRARSLTVLAILLLSLLGGLWVPSFALPAWVQRLAQALPTTWALRGLAGATWQGLSTKVVWRCAGVVVAFSTGFLTLALCCLARSETKRIMQGDQP
jgi:ABC-2 type transport system permease protein